MNNPKLKLKLTQHTPIIHFQPDQKGATLRATEVKPKLDRFVISKLGQGDYEKGKKKARDTGWLMGKGDHPALNYQLGIKAKGGAVTKDPDKLPMYFGNMGGEAVNKKDVMHEEGVSLTIQSFRTELLKAIKQHIGEFFAIHNFGTRQSKGYGSFTIEKQAIKCSWFDYVIDHSFNSYDETMEALDLFYQCIRGGINKKKKTGNDFYFKSLLFLYFKQKNIQWEKKTIKQNFFEKDKLRPHLSEPIYRGRATQEASRGTDILTFSSEQKLLTKDLLGLSSKESWSKYDKAIISKKHRNGKGDAITRFRSPVLFKVLPEGKQYKVWIKFQDLSAMKGQTFEISNGQKSFNLTTPNDFSLADYFKFIEGVNIQEHMKKEFCKHKNGDTIKTMFQHLTKIG